MQSLVKHMARTDYLCLPEDMCMNYLPCHTVKIQSQQKGSATKSGRGKSCLTASVSCSDDDYIVILFVVPLMCLQSQRERLNRNSAVI